MIHPNTELRFISRDVGYGVVATQDIPQGTITWALDRLDRVFTPAEVDAMEPLYRNVLHTYCYRDRRGMFILCWDHGRFVNHSFHANCMTTAYGFELAIRDIRAGEELTDDYGFLNIEAPFRAKDEGTRRKTVYPDDLLRYHQQWDRKLRTSFDRLLEVDQPLRIVIPDDTWATASRVSRREEDMMSILTCHCPHPTRSNGAAHPIDPGQS